MRILPVLDLKQGVVVRGIGGRRDEYLPVKSRLTASAQPLDVARAFRAHFGFRELYVADLDAIAGSPPAVRVLGALLNDGFRLWVDAGVGPDLHNLQMLADAGAHTLIVGLESVSGPALLHDVFRSYSSEKIVFSLDMKNGESLGPVKHWTSARPVDVARQAMALGVRRLLVLDLADVGAGAGTRTADLCQHLRAMYPHLELTAGGGIRGAADLARLTSHGVDWALVASALHDGRLTRDELASFPP
jgi:phosphoribosylformimino-5-aminoimidazole carboxamide ribotide isomerase